MKQLRSYWQENRIVIAVSAIAALVVAGLLLYKLGTLTAGLSSNENHTATAAVGWHGIYNHPLDLPLKLVQSAIYSAFPSHGALLTRLPNVLFGGVAIACFSWLIWLWHGPRTTILATMLFATSAWTLHVSRIASNDVLYLAAIPIIIIAQLQLQHSTKKIVWYACIILAGLLLYVPGLVWLLAVSALFQRNVLVQGWKRLPSLKHRILSGLAVIIWLPLLIIDFLRPGELALWLGLPHHLAAPLDLLKQFVGVFVHLFVRGPQYPEIWLGRLPILDVFTLVACVVGIYFYALRPKSKRSRLLGSMAAVSILLIAIGGPVPLSIIVPVAYMTAATGVAYLLHDWLKVFPSNPFARNLGITLMAFAVIASCNYNLRSYFVAWPHNAITEATFRSNQSE